MIILTLDTTKKQGVIGLEIDNVANLEKTKEHDTHSESLLPKVQEMLLEKNLKIKDIDIFGVLIGPGSFTGIRIGVSMVKAFLFGSTKQCVAVNSFEVLAYNVKTPASFFALLPADGRGAYVAHFNKNKQIENYYWLSFEELENLVKEKNLPVFIKNEDEDYFKQLNIVKNLVNVKDDDLLNVVKQKIKNNEFIDKNNLEPLYIRLSQAEDQLKQNFYKNVSFEVANLDNLQELFKLEKDIFEVEAYNENSLKDELTLEDRVVIVAKFKEQIIGYVMVLKTNDNMLNIIKIATSKNYQNLKVATKLFEQVLTIKQNENYDNIFLEVNEHNTPAISFYKKMGFKQVSKRQNYYKNGDAALVMML